MAACKTFSLVGVKKLESCITTEYSMFVFDDRKTVDNESRCVLPCTSENDKIMSELKDVINSDCYLTVKMIGQRGLNWL